MPVTQTIIAKSYAGLTLTASIHNRLTDADLAPGSTIVVDEINAGGGIYSIVITHATTLISAVTGRLKLFDGGELVDNDQLFTFAGADGETVDTGAAVLDSGTQAQLQSIEDGVDANTGYLTSVVSSITTITNRIGAWTGTGINTVLGAFRAIAAKAAALTPSDLSTGTTFDNTTDSLEAAKDAAGSGLESALMVSTTIATLTSQTAFTLTAGSADDDAYNRQLVVVTDSATATQKARGIVSDYVGATKTVTLTGALAFTIAPGDSVSIIAIGSDASSSQIASAISSAIVSAGISATVTGMPTFLRVGDARTVANGYAIPVRLYDVDDDTLLFGIGEKLFADATITFSLRRAGTDSTEGTEDAVIPCTWVEDGDDGYVQIAYEADALDDCDAMDKLKEKDCHRWGIKFQWGTDDPITPIYGNISVLRKIVTTQ